MNIITKIFACLSIICCVLSCDSYERTDVEKSIYVNLQSLNLLVGDKVQLIASPTQMTYNWNSEDPLIAEVNQDGLVEAIGEGTTNIIVYDGDVQTMVPVVVNLKIELEDVEFAESDFVEIETGGKTILSAIPIPGNANDYSRFTWSSDNENIVTVDVMGQITAIKPGIANITVTAGEFSKTIEVKVYRTVNVALHKSVTVSSVFDPQFVGENVVDGILDTSDASNRWVSQSTNIAPQWIIVDFGDEYKINSLQFWNQLTWPSYDFQFQKEVEEEWVDIFIQTGNTAEAYSKTFEETTASKVRLYFTRGSFDGIVRMYEMRVNGKVYE